MLIAPFQSPGSSNAFSSFPSFDLELIKQVESLQIDKDNPESMRMFKEGTHFNPVDLVCAIKDCDGNPYNLPQFVGFLVSAN